MKEEELIKRIANRRSCKGCSEIYNVVFNPPKTPGICDKCGGELYQREDQKPEVVDIKDWFDKIGETTRKVVKKY